MIRNICSKWNDVLLMIGDALDSFKGQVGREEVMKSMQFIRAGTAFPGGSEGFEV